MIIIMVSFLLLFKCKASEGTLHTLMLIIINNALLITFKVNFNRTIQDNAYYH